MALKKYDQLPNEQAYLLDVPSPTAKKRKTKPNITQHDLS